MHEFSEHLLQTYPLWSHFQAISLQLFFSCRVWYNPTAAWPTWAATCRDTQQNSHFNSNMSICAENSLYVLFVTKFKLSYTLSLKNITVFCLECNINPKINETPSYSDHRIW